MILICTVYVISGIFYSSVTVEGRMLSENKTKYFVDFSVDLEKNNWKLSEGQDGKKLVPKEDCVKK